MKTSVFTCSRITTTAVLLCGMGLAACTREEIRWQDRVLPLPQEMEVSGYSRVRAGDIRYTIRAKEDAAPYETVRFLLDGFARGGADAKLEIELVLVDETPDAVQAELRERLETAPNAPQAYVMVSRDGRPARITIAANTPVGLLYGAHTVRQLILPGRLGETIGPETRLDIPRVRIVDWPDVAFRGSRETAAYTSFGWNSQWKINLHCFRLTTWRGDNVPFGTTKLEIRRMADIDSDLFRSWMQWGKELGFLYLTTVEHLGHMAPTGLAGISPAVYTEEYPRPANRMAHGFCWAEGQEIYTVLEEEMRKAADIAAQFPSDQRIIAVLLTEHEGTSCYCPECQGASGYVMETEAILGIFQRLKQEDPSLQLKITLSQGSRPVNDRIMELISAVPDVGVGYYDGRLTYRNDRNPMIPETLEIFSRAGGFINVVMTLMPARWDTQTPGSLPHYVQEKAQEFADKDIQSASQYDMVGAQFYWPLTMAAWGEYLWNANGRSVEDFARAYATITGIADPDLFGRWADKAGEAAYELGVSQYLMNMGGARHGLLPQVIGEDQPQELATIRLDNALRDAKEALLLARMAGADVLRWESEYTLAAVKSLALRVELQEKMRSAEHRDEAAHALDMLDVCAQVALASARAWHEHAAAEMVALAESPGFLRPPELLFRIRRDGERIIPSWRQKRAWTSLLHAADLERISASVLGIPDLRGDRAPQEIAFWEAGDFQNGRAQLELDATEWISPRGGYYLLGFHTLEGAGSTMRVLMKGVQPGTGETREISNASLWGMTATRANDSFYDHLLFVPDREGDEEWKLTLELRAVGGGAHSAGFVTLRRIWGWDEIPEEAIDRLLEE